MSVENVKMFYEAVSKDEALKQKFMELSQKYQGQPMDEEKAISLLEQEALPLAAQMGYYFTLEDLKEYSEEMQQTKMNCEISDEELHAVSGGTGRHLACPFLGFIAEDGDPSSVGDFACFCLGFDNAGSCCVFIGWVN